VECPPRIEKGVVLVAMRKQISPDPWSVRASHGAGEIRVLQVNKGLILRVWNDVIAGSFLKRSQMVQKLTKDA